MSNTTISIEKAEFIECIDSLDPSLLRSIRESLQSICKQDTEQNNQFHEIDTLIGVHFSIEDRLKLAIDSLADSFKYRQTLLAESISSSKVAEILNTSRQTPHDRVRVKTLLAIVDNGELKFPLWQFDPSGSNGVIEGFPEVLKALKVSDFAKLSWFVTVSPYLGFTPIEALQRGLKDQVIKEASAIGYGQN